MELVAKLHILWAKCIKPVLLKKIRAFHLRSLRSIRPTLVLTVSTTFFWTNFLTILTKFTNIYFILHILIFAKRTIFVIFLELCCNIMTISLHCPLEYKCNLHNNREILSKINYPVWLNANLYILPSYGDSSKVDQWLQNQITDSLITIRNDYWKQKENH